MIDFKGFSGRSAISYLRGTAKLQQKDSEYIDDIELLIIMTMTKFINIQPFLEMKVWVDTNLLPPIYLK